MNWPLIGLAVGALINLALCVVGLMSILEWVAR